MEKINLIYILGRAFTGSTILEMILDTHSEVMSAGEMIYLPRIYRNRSKIKCSCLKNAEDCQVWSEIFKIYKADAEKKQFENVFELTPKKSYFKIVSRKMNKSFTKEEIKEYAEKNYIFFNTIKKVTEKKVIVDSSKNPYRLYMLKKSGLFNIKIIYLYRDGRASIDSFKKRNKKNYNILNRMFRIIVGEYILRKTLKHSFARNQYYGLRYETFTENFDKEIVALLKFLNLDNEKDFFINKNSNNYFLRKINEGTSHIVGGNIYRLQKVEGIKNYEAWKNRLTKLEKFIFLILGGKALNKSMQKFIH